MNARAKAIGSVLVLALAGFGRGCGGCSSTGDPIARKITAADQLIGGREASGRIGDWILANDKARFVVQDAGSSTGWGVFGGSLVDLDVARAKGEPGDDRLVELFHQCELRGFEPESATIVDDGSGGGPAVLRLSGKDRGIPFLDAVIPTEPLQVSIETDYVLARDSDTLEIVLRIHDERKMGSREISCGVVLIRGDATDGYFASAGRDADRTIGEPPYLGAAAFDADASWVLYREEGDWRALAPQADVTVLSGNTRPFLANQTLEQRYFISVGRNGDLESALAARRGSHPPTPSPALREVKIAWSVPPVLERWRSQARAYFFDAARPETSAFVTGARDVAMLPAGSYRVDLELAGRKLSEVTVEVPNDGATAPIEVNAAITGAGVVHVQSFETTRAGERIRAMPARVNVGGRIEAYFRADDTFFLEAGEYNVVGSLGPEHELATAHITVANGETTELELEIARVVDTTGWIAADFHVHSTRSVDASAARIDRVLGAIAEGLDLMVTTDHDTISDFAPVARELGVESLVKLQPGIEMSMLYGHMNGFPLPAESPEAYYRPAWFRYDAAGKFERMLEPIEVSAALRGLGAEIVQINHPRDDTGVFNYIRLDPQTAESAREWPNPDTCEILNGKRLDDWSAVFTDVNALIAHGKKITVTGTSDSHSTLGVGYARTMIRSASDDPAALDLPAIWRALREGRAIAMNGPFVSFTAAAGGGVAELGDTLSAEGGAPVVLTIRVEAPSWMDAGRVVVFENGAVFKSIDIEASDADPTNPAIRFQGTVTATTAGDAHYMVMIEGHDGVENPPPHKNGSRTITNPIYVDRDGGGFHLR